MTRYDANIAIFDTMRYIVSTLEQTRYFPSYPPDDHHCSDDVYLREWGTDHGDRLHFYEKHGQLVTTPWNTTVNSSHDFTMWRVDRV